MLVFLATQSSAQYFSKKIKGNNKIITETRNLSDYDKIGVAGSFDVELIKGNEGKITIKADENLMEYIITEVKKGSLKIKTKKGYNLRPSKTIKITVPFESISSVALAGSGDVYSDAIIDNNDFKLSVAGSGDMDLKIDTQKLESNIAGSGNINLKGNSKEFNCKIAGSGNFNGYDLKTSAATIKIAGSGNVKVNATENIHAKIAGSGNVYYTGNPTINKTSVGSGSIKKKN